MACGTLEPQQSVQLVVPRLEMEVDNGAMADRRHFTVGCSCPPLDASAYGHHLALVSLCLGDAVTPVDAQLSPKT
jgi:hypothetical protein